MRPLGARMAAVAATAACAMAVAADTGTAAGAAAPDEGSVRHGHRGASGSVEVVHPGFGIRPRPVREGAAPVTVRVVRVGEGRSRVEYVGWETGTHDLLPLLERTDGRPIEGMNPIVVEVVSQLPPDAGTDLYGRSARELRVGAPYRALMAGAVALWIAVPAVVLVRRALRRPVLATPAAPPRRPDAVERLLEAVALAKGSEAPSVDARARLELLLLKAVRGDDGGDPAAGIARARTDVRTARAVAAVERWLHAPTAGDRASALAEIEALRLEPRSAP